MISQGQKWKMTITSVLSLVSVFAFLVLLNWFLIQIGAYVSDFEGVIEWEILTPIALSDTWNKSQVLWIYLFPYLSFIVIYFTIDQLHLHYINLPRLLLLSVSWAYFFLLMWVFFMPLIDILLQKGIFYALTWLNISRLMQFAFGIGLWLFLFYRSFLIARLFSCNLVVPADKIATASIITNQLVFLWYIPFLILVIIIFLVQGITPFNSKFLIGMLLLVLVNTWLIRRYKVIV